MPRRMNPNLRQKLLGIIIQKDGDVCMLCLQSPVKKKTIDHLDCNIRNNKPENLLLLCHSCNVKEGNRARGQLGRKITSENLHEYRARLLESRKLHPQVTRGGGGGGDSTGRVTTSTAISHWEGYTLPTQSNATLMDAYFRLWLFRLVGGQGEVSTDEAVNSGAEFLSQQIGNGSQKTTQRYFDKVTSSEGWLMKREGSNRPAIWVFRINIDFEILESKLRNQVLANGGNLTFKKSWLKTESNKE